MKKLIIIALLFISAFAWGQSAPVKPQGPKSNTIYIDTAHLSPTYKARWGWDGTQWYVIPDSTYIRKYAGAGDTLSVDHNFRFSGTITNHILHLNPKDTTGVDSTLAWKNGKLYIILGGGAPSNLGNSDLTQSDPTRTFTVGTGTLNFIAVNGSNNTSLSVSNSGVDQNTTDGSTVSDIGETASSAGIETEVVSTGANASVGTANSSGQTNFAIQVSNGTNSRTITSTVGSGAPFGINFEDDIDSVGNYYHGDYHIQGIAKAGNRWIPDVGWVNSAIAAGGGGTTPFSLTVNNSGSGTASPFTFNGSAAKTISYNSIGAQPTLVSGTNLKTINSTSLLGSSNILLQTPLTAGTDYLAPNGSAALLTSFPTLNQNTTGTAANVTATSNSTLTTLSALSLPYSQVTGTPSLTGFVPYTGATTNVVLGANTLSGQSFAITGTGGLGFLNLPTQSSTPTTPSSGQHVIYTNAAGQFSIMGSNGFALGFSRALLTASRVFSYPDATTTLLGTDNMASVSNKTFLPANVYQTPIGTTSTDSIAVKLGSTGKLGAIATSGIQKTLTAGTNITIVGTTISATGGGSGTYTSNETPSGTINSSNTSFTLAHTPVSGTVSLYLNGLYQVPSVDYTISSGTVTYSSAPFTGDSLMAIYTY